MTDGRAALATLLLLMGSAMTAADCAPFEVVGDRIPAPLGGHEGSAEQGARIARDRQRGDCVICHRLPAPDERFQGNVGPALHGIGDRLDAAQIRLRIAANRQLHPQSVMPDYCRSGDRHAVDRRFEGEPLLSAAEIEHLVAWLSNLHGNQP